ncbi:hypothetical protein ABPG72_006748 [Tetrahymena utriculariae]
MNSFEINLVKQIKQYFLNNQIEVCLNKVEQYDQNTSFICHQNLQLYKMQSLFELAYFKEAHKYFEEIIEERNKVKGDKIDSIDVITIVQYLNQMFCFNDTQCEKVNKQLFKVCQQYREQNENQESYDVGVQLFGEGIYQFIKTIREEDNLSFITDLVKAYDLLDEYKQDILSSLQQIYYSKGKLNESEKWAQLLYNLNPKYPGIANNLASLYLEKYQFEEAIKLYQEEEKHCPNNHVVLRNLANIYRDIGDTQKEEEYCKRAYEILPRSAYSCHRYGIFKYKHNYKEQAIEMFNEGINIDPQVLGNYLQLAEIATDDNDFGTAIYHLKKCIEINPEEGYQYYRLGNCLQKFQRYDEAIEQYNISIQKQTYQNIKIDCTSQIAFCYYKQQNYSKSLEIFFNTCSINSSKYNYQSDIGNICSLINGYISLKEAIKIISKQEDKCLNKFQQIKEGIENSNLKSLFQYKLDIFRECIQIRAYKKHIQQNITFQSQYSHLDLYLD